ncbi:MAG: type I methionyl aminopeptidase, partial [bacterium]|nr:type I methionyl aminopeptidase [bacterium]
MITIKTSEEIKIMAEGGKILARIMKELEGQVRPGITTRELDKAAEGLVLSSGAKCSFKGYHGYPACLCTSVNEEVVHAIPSDRVLKEGDIISLDLGVFYNGYHSDMAITVPVGKISPEAQKLIKVTKESLEIGIKEAMVGRTFGDIGSAIQKYVESHGFNVVRDLCGHGIGKDLHEDPEILNYGKPGVGPKIKEGMVFCLEPMVTAGDWRIKKSQDGQGFVTADGSLSAHFEHTIAVTKNG